MEQPKRSVAIKCMIIDLINGEYVKKDGWEPNYVTTKYGNVNRANVLGVVVSIINPNSFILDDGSGKVIVRSFDAPLNNSLGDVITIIGRPREYNNDFFLVPEIIKKIDNNKWVELRKKELALTKKKTPTRASRKTPSSPQQSPPQTSDNVLATIKELDDGDGADVDEVIKKSGLTTCEDVIGGLLKDGDIYEIRPGKLKVLE